MKKSYIYLFVACVLCFVTLSAGCISTDTLTNSESSDLITVNITSISFYPHIASAYGPYTIIGFEDDASYKIIEAHFRLYDSEPAHIIEKGDSNYAILSSSMANPYYTIHKLVLTEEMFEKAF